MYLLPRLAAFAALITIPFALGGCASLSLDATGAKVQSTVVLEDVEEFQLAQLSNNSYAVVRVDPEEYGHVVEGYDDALAVKWKHSIPFDRDHQISPLWLVGGPAGVTMIYNRFEDDDTLSVHGLILDPATGAVRKTEPLTGINIGGRNSQISHVRLAFSPDSTRFALYWYDYTKLEEDNNKTVGLRSELFDTKLNRLGKASLEIPVNDDIDDPEHSDLYVQTFFVANDGHAYQVSYHNKSFLRVSQLDYTNGTTKKLEHSIPGIDFDEDDMQMHGTKGWTGDGQEVIVAAGKPDDEELRAVVLVGMNFATNHVDFVNSVEITESLAEKLVDDSELEYFRLRDIIRTPGGEIVLPLEQVEVGVVTSREKNVLFRTSTTIYVHQDMVMMGFNPKGEAIWFAGQDRPKVTTLWSDYRSDAWRIEGDSIHYIYRDEDMDGLVAGAISVKTGTMSFPRSLLETSMIAENRFTKWLGPNNALMVLSMGTDYRLVRFSY